MASSPGFPEAVLLPEQGLGFGWSVEGGGEEGMRTPAVFTQHHWGFRAIHGTQTLSDSEILLSAWAAFLTKITTWEGLLLGHGFVRITNYTVKPPPGQA